VSRLILLNKPYGVLTQFTSELGRTTLKDFVPVPKVYPAGRLDADSEGLVLLTDDGALQTRISDPHHKLAKRYWVQVEGIPESGNLARLSSGLDLGDFFTAECECKVIEEPASLWPRTPPIRVRAAIPTTWLEIILREGKNRQIRRMTAKIGFPCLRLIRYSIGNWSLQEMQPGQWREEKTR
jgi:23S rRNA pseudouridine2457 synthase